MSESVKAWRPLLLLRRRLFIAPGFDAEEVLELPAEMGTSEQMLFSVAVDYKALECTV
jgi:hypothetical protein